MKRGPAGLITLIAGPALLALCPTWALAAPSVADGEDGLSSVLHWTTRGVELVGISIIVLGAVVATARYLNCIRSPGTSDGGPYHAYRSDLGRAILLGLEFLVAADIIGTVAIEPSLESVAILGLIVLIRTFLSFSLEVEIGGKLPWRGANSKQNTERSSPPRSVQAAVGP